MRDDDILDKDSDKKDLIATVNIETGESSSVHTTQDLSEPLPIRATTRSLETSELIRQFVYQFYSREHYAALAERAQSLIETGLKNLRDGNGDEIQAKVMYRAKKKDSLEEKLKMKEIEHGKQYEKIEEIQKDVKDLAGVRIILYTPTQAQHDSVKDMIFKIWGTEVEIIKHDGSTSSHVSEGLQVDAQKKKRYVRKHLGYQASHYRAPMTKNQEIEGKYEYKPNDCVEIQVVSAFGHAWAEAGHDVLYKSHAYGPPSEREERILDALSGLVSTGDLLLEEFRSLLNQRTHAKWKQQEELTMFLYQTDVLKNPSDEPKEGEEGLEDYCVDFSPETTGITFSFLVSIGKNYPLAVRNALKEDLGYNHNPIKSLNEVATFIPRLEPPRGYLAPLSLIFKMLLKHDSEEKDRKKSGLSAPTNKDPSTREKCTHMMKALMLLQIFAGSYVRAKDFLQEIQWEKPEKDSLNFVLQNPHRSICFDESVENRWMEMIDKDLRPAWTWFEKQVNNRTSLCGLFFRLVEMGVHVDIADEKLVKALKIGSLSRPGTLPDWYLARSNLTEL